MLLLHMLTYTVQNGMNIKNSKETILNQALAIFGRLGFHKTTMADIANASKRGRRTIYTYFRNKEEVYDAVVEREIDKMLSRIKQRVEETPEAKKKLSIYIELRLKSIIELTQRYDALQFAYVNNYRWVEKISAKLDSGEKEILADILSLGIKEKTFHFDQLNEMVLNIHLIIRGIEFILIKENNELITQRQIASMQETLLVGLLTR